MEEMNASIETLQNPILQILLYGTVAIIVAQTTAIVYLFRFSTTKYVELSRDSITALADASRALMAMKEELAELRDAAGGHSSTVKKG